MQNKNISTEKQIQQYRYRSKDCFQGSPNKVCGSAIVPHTLPLAPPSQESNQERKRHPICAQLSPQLKHALKTGSMNVAGNIKYWAVGWTAQQFNLQCMWYKHILAEHEQQNWLKILKIKYVILISSALQSITVLWKNHRTWGQQQNGIQTLFLKTYQVPGAMLNASVTHWVLTDTCFSLVSCFPHSKWSIQSAPSSGFRRVHTCATIITV